MRLASWMSFGTMVTRFAWIAHRLVSSNTKSALLWNRKSLLKSCAISLTSLWKGSFRINNSVDFWYFLISRSATVPGQYRWGFFTPPVAGADLRAALVANCLRGAFPPIDSGSLWMRAFVPSALDHEKQRKIWRQESSRMRQSPKTGIHNLEDSSFMCS
ncbi:hypothetical protein MPTK1_2g24960 [Marchantia polymorpha subsp. ruderalis]|uniref:Uncharacterized protein n=1 Tax=Marchantia polymorpha TaxID=3197 RepID=A0A2R6VY18_MARPO|nr:hypothetical protein MARPO_1337s0001 [Marchantia polymorpha]BBN03625.1 hypothetical protein Mp_2g24960 [Marchantia polymorpha subsp. ruderalis]|eukprot:PTQ26501.1 hypothetical protein MARPO_1337s0001 [Marchantia polymorpha]